jgi:hypothetical protein
MEEIIAKSYKHRQLNSCSPCTVVPNWNVAFCFPISTLTIAPHTYVICVRSARDLRLRPWQDVE